MVYECKKKKCCVGEWDWLYGQWVHEHRLFATQILIWEHWTKFISNIGDYVKYFYCLHLWIKNKQYTSHQRSFMGLNIVWKINEIVRSIFKLMKKKSFKSKFLLLGFKVLNRCSSPCFFHCSVSIPIFSLILNFLWSFATFLYFFFSKSCWKGIRSNLK